MSEIFSKEGFLVTVDIEKAFEFTNHLFVIAALEKIGFGTELIKY